VEPTSGWNIILDIAAVMSAVLWPAAVLVILLVLRDRLPDMIKGLADRIKRVETPALSFELAEAKSFTPDWSGVPGAFDLRNQAAAMQVTDSTRRMFVEQLLAPGSADYAVVNLGTGKEWLTSRLYIMSILFARMKGLRAFVFLETEQGVRKRYAGWADPVTLRWTLAKCYPWLETAYADAYSQIIGPLGQNTVVVSNQGRLGYTSAPNNVQPSIDLLQNFLQRIQAPTQPTPNPLNNQEWVVVDSTTNTYEHATRIDGQQLENILGNDLYLDALRQAELQDKKPVEQFRALLAMPGEFIALTADSGRFQSLILRTAVLKQMAEQLSSGEP
jgi:hypothetical protein